MNGLGLINLALCFGASLWFLSRSRLSSLYWSAATVFGGLPLAFASSVVLAERPDYRFDDITANRVATFVLCFNAVCLTTHALLSWSRGSRVRGSKAPAPSIHAYAGPELERSLLVSLSLGFAGVAGILLSQGIPLLGTRWTDVAEFFEGRSQYSYVIATSLFIVGSASAPVAWLRGHRAVAGCVLVACFAMSQMTGSRTFLLGPVLALTWLALIPMTVHDRRRSTLHTIVILIALVASYSVFSFTSWSRSKYSNIELLTTPTAILTEYATDMTLAFDKSSGALFYAFEAFSDESDFLGGVTYREMMLVGFPRSILRPLGLDGLRTGEFSGLLLARDLYGEGGHSRFGSIHPTLWGDAQANFGFAGILVGIAWGALLVLIDRTARRPVFMLAILPALASGLWVLTRGSMLHATYYLLYPAAMAIPIVAASRRTAAAPGVRAPTIAQRRLQRILNERVMAERP